MPDRLFEEGSAVFIKLHQVVVLHSKLRHFFHPVFPFDDSSDHDAGFIIADGVDHCGGRIDNSSYDRNLW